MSDTEIEIDCGENLSIAEIGDFYGMISMAVAEGKSIKFNVSKIERVDGAALQLLYAYAKEELNKGNGVTWTQPSEAFIRSANLLGMLPVMNLEKHLAELLKA